MMHYKKYPPPESQTDQGYFLDWLRRGLSGKDYRVESAHGHILVYQGQSKHANMMFDVLDPRLGGLWLYARARSSRPACIDDFETLMAAFEATFMVKAVESGDGYDSG